MAYYIKPRERLSSETGYESDEYWKTKYMCESAMGYDVYEQDYDDFGEDEDDYDDDSDDYKKRRYDD